MKLRFHDKPHRWVDMKIHRDIFRFINYRIWMEVDREVDDKVSFALVKAWPPSVVRVDIN